MASFVNRSSSILDLGGKRVAPGEVVSLTKAQEEKDPLIGFLRAMKFIEEGSEPLSVIGATVSIPTVEEAQQGATIKQENVVKK